MEILDWSTVLEPFIALFVLIILMILMLILYLKIRIFLAILLLFLFSLIIGINAMSYEFIPFNPYLSIFFMLFQSVFFLMTSLQLYDNLKYKV